MVQIALMETFQVFLAGLVFVLFGAAVVGVKLWAKKRRAADGAQQGAAADEGGLPVGEEARWQALE